ncbi:inositol 1,4,5-triphosphate receptor associated 2 [Acanthochromis polyacanthus]|uniref:Lymphoid-restricted membrane protein-like n=1 Tax=Acanthochromis polyacanthus TaxID=80966 RepID=A0A3Q1ELG5_9TELE|nr:inositol 1,4,5-triphosphate receptor associated 2 [Acanthochromis polyacanthus]XP_022059229.1 inositol 1,4,5-triphosphate receptor associated 2 [Acanthochromis polyacanthus]XP_051805989.1 inositol 1,4,5-triphosphate receptor associated 2 [Acanthochromis polyacanthus]XP_051805990.1 inositol 1,4,5-triphosphate receptor associated 2 [Acanthochromis polyacanthus]XP_051805991.1 inositol 1,4,5-triphosphate receptor associated 2 [Acanthochromis polyacanthus]
MNAETDAETNGPNLSVVLDSDDSEEETSQEEPPGTSWSDLSIIERVGLNSIEMPEKDLEAAFAQISLAFRCDQYTLKQRLQAEEHARNLAEENVQLELSRGRETLETLKGLCLDSKRSKILQRLELSLDILGGTVERISNTAEVLGAVHQEARVSRAVELMVAHVETLRRRHDKNVAELEEAKKMVQQQNSCRITRDPGGSPDSEDGDRPKGYKQNNLRRRVSISVISSQVQEKRRQSSESSFSALTRDDSYVVDERPLEPDEPPSAAPPDPPPIPECPPSKPATARKTQNKNSSLDTLRQRQKGKAALSKKKEKKTNMCQRISAGTNGSLKRKPHLTRWMYRCRWALICTYLFVLFCVVSLTYFLWKLQDGALEP